MKVKKRITMTDLEDELLDNPFGGHRENIDKVLNEMLLKLKAKINKGCTPSDYIVLNKLCLGVEAASESVVKFCEKNN